MADKRGGKKVSCYWMTLTKMDDTENGKRKRQIAVCVEPALEEDMDLS
jgi:hypothetical protein